MSQLLVAGGHFLAVAAVLGAAIAALVLVQRRFLVRRLMSDTWLSLAGASAWLRQGRGRHHPPERP